MSFLCQVTGKLSRQGDPRIGEFLHMGEPGAKASDEARGSEKLNRIVVETRTREYKNWDEEAEEEWFSYGTEIVREINASDEGVRLWESWTPEQREVFAKNLK